MISYRLPMMKCSFLLLAVLFNSSVEAVWKEGVFKWRGDAGYSVVAEFTFDDSVEVAQGEYGWAPVVGLQRLVSFVYDPAGKLLFVCRDIVNGYSQYNWLYFYFDVRNKGFVEDSEIDIGYDPGYYLWGNRLGTSVENMGLAYASEPGDAPKTVVMEGLTLSSFPTFTTAFQLPYRI